MVELYDITRYYKHMGLIGESNIAVALTAITLSGKSIGFGIEASAGSGKTVLLDTCFGKAKLNDGLIDQKYTYFKDAGSDKSLSYDADEINTKKIIVMSELQKDKGHATIEAIKSLTEGKSAIYRTVDITANGGTGGISEYEITKKCVVYSLAIENDTKPDAELQRRFITMATDISQEQTATVVRQRAKSRWNRKSTDCMSTDDINDLKSHVNMLMELPTEIYNPFAEKYASVISEFAPDQKVRSMAEHFWDLLESITKFNFANRVPVNAGYLVNIQDLLITLDIYQYSFIRDVYGIPSLGDNVLKAFDHTGIIDNDTSDEASTLSKHLSSDISTTWLTVNQIRRIIKSEFKIVLSSKVIYTICRQLVDAGYLEDRREGSAYQYRVLDHMKDFEKPNIEELINDAAMKVKESYPDKYSDWLEQQRKPYINPVTGKLITITVS